MIYLNKLDNGIKLIHKQNNSNIAHCAIILNIGSRDELEDESGIAHFIEHMFFKGTKKRNSYHILNYLDNVGGDINAYTTKEEIIIHASFIKDYFERAVELLYDIIFNSTFPEKEIEKEKDVIIDEINSYKDSPSELIFDEIEEIIFNKKGLGNNILGTENSVKKINRDKIINFLKKNLSPSKVTFSSVGDISEKKLQKVYSTFFEKIEKKELKLSRDKTIISKNSYIEKDMDTSQSHIILATSSYSIKSDKLSIVNLINTYLAGPSMSSLLNIKLREKHGIAYNIESFFTPYSDSGIFGIYLGTDKKNIEKSLSIINKEINNINNKYIGKNNLSKIKKQLIGQFSFAQENYLNMAISLGKTYSLFDKIDSLEEIIDKINSIKEEDIMKCSNDFFIKENLTTLIYK